MGELSPHQERILELLPADKYELSSELDISASTVKDHINRLRSFGYEIKFDYSEKVYHVGDEPPAEDNAAKIGNDEVVQYLEDGSPLSRICDKLHATESAIRDVIDRLDGQGYEIRKKDTGQETIFHIPDEIDRRFDLDAGSGHHRFALISDTHLGSKAEHLQELEEFYDRCVDRGVTRVFHCGDISDGWKVHTGHLNEIKDEAAGWGRLKEYVISNYPQRGSITTHFIEGNHDNKFYNRNNIRFGRLIADQRDDLHYCGNAQATFILDKANDIDLELIHPSGGKPYTTGYRLQTLFRERNVSERPSIAGVGHLHGSMYAETEGVKGLYAGAWKGTTTYGKRKGHQAKIGGWILDVSIKDGIISQLVPQWHGWEERATGNRHDVESID